MNFSSDIRGIDFELSSICNAVCTSCPRRVEGRMTNFEQSYHSFAEVKRILDDEIIRGLLCFDMCGNFGDVMANPDIVPIVEWIRELNASCDIRIKTNGSLGKPEQFKRLAELGVEIRFGLDGVGEKNELYRVNAKWNKIEENFKAFASGNQKPQNLHIQFLLWAETTDQIIPMLDFADQNKCGVLFLRYPSSNEYGIVDVYNQHSEKLHSLTAIDPNHALKPFMDTEWSRDKFAELREFLNKIDLTPKKLGFFDYANSVPAKEMTSIGGISRSAVDSEIKAVINKAQSCYSKNIVDHFDVKTSQLDIYITHDGLAFPCCLIAPAVSKALDSMNIVAPHLKSDMLSRMERVGFDRFSVRDKTLRQVIDSGVMHEFVYTDIESGQAMDFCKKSCEKCK